MSTRGCPENAFNIQIRASLASMDERRQTHVKPLDRLPSRAFQWVGPLWQRPSIIGNGAGRASLRRGRRRLERADDNAPNSKRLHHCQTSLTGHHSDGLVHHSSVVYEFFRTSTHSARSMNRHLSARLPNLNRIFGIFQCNQ